jgi:hypothetical protein
MATPLPELEGTWEEIMAHAPELAGRRVRLIVLKEAPEEPYPGIPPEERPSTAASLLKYAGTWEGDDLEECLRLAYSTRSKAKFFVA